MDKNTDNKVYWHLPGFCVFFYLNQVIINNMKIHPELFKDNYAVGAVYGSFPGAIWNGGRAVLGLTVKSDMEKIIKTYNDFDVPVKFTFTNSLIEEKHLQDTYCNLIMQVANNGKNHVLVNRPVLEEYLRANYPNFKYISSTTKRIKSVDAIIEELKKDYELVVLDYDLNKDEQVLKELEPYADRIEILVDEICYPNCPRRLEHYKDEALKQLTFDRTSPFPCPNRSTAPSFEEAKKRPGFIGNDIIGSYIERGYRNFKLVGRGLPMELVLDSYIYYLAKDECAKELRSIVVSTLEKLNVRIK